MAVVNEAALAIAPFQPLQILGPAGHGKTTHLLALLTRHPGAIYEYVPPGSHQFRTRPVPDRMFLLDEAQRVDAGQLRDLFVHQPWLALGTHDDLQSHCPHPIRTLRVGMLSIEKLQAVVSQRMAWAVNDPDGPVPTVCTAQLARLQESHGGNLRSILHDLYDWIQRGQM